MTEPNTPHRPRFVELSPDRVSRFWKEVTVASHTDGGWAVLLDGRTPKTPAKAQLVLPTEAAARLVADEWAAQGEFLDPNTMPATRLASTAIDRIGQAREPVADEIAAYAGTDVVCYLAEHPTPLVKRQEAAWTPWREWAAREMGVALEPAVGIIHQPQSEASIARVKAHALTLDDMRLTGLATAVPLLGSAVLALALEQGVLPGEEAFDLSRIDELFQEEQWGVDAEAAERTEARRAEAVLLQQWFAALA
ncbi:ATP12 family protein [Brevundimonas sp.]|uniref:ATP12 family chaperone protein n=1 Tax=Brevundimonas sp. TaxID=1871086 RepID=UPI0025BD08DA|nr:ATP12 family protein [Brevundimonas sp.]